jgi:hypothetical protein
MANAEVVPTQASRDRKLVKAWLREQVVRLGRTPSHFGTLTGLMPEWLDLALDPEHSLCPSSDIVEQVCRALRVTLSHEVRTAAQRITAAARPPAIKQAARPRAGARRAVTKIHGARKAFNASVSTSPLPTSCTTADSELRELVNRAVGIAWPHSIERNGGMMRDRLGLGRETPMTLDELGSREGISRERVRQLEDKLFDVLTSKLAGVATPRLDELITEFNLASGVSIEVFTAQFVPLIGESSLVTVLAVASRLHGTDLLQGLKQSSVGRDELVTIIGSTRDAELANRIAVLGRRLQRYAGAVLVDVLRRKVERELGETISLERVLGAIELLKNVQWLDDAKFWYWQTTEPDSNLVRTAAEIGFLARRAFSFEVLYAGLTREARVISPSEIAEHGPPVPPADVVSKLLERHPRFRRRYASTIEYCGPAVDLARADAARTHLVNELNRRRGVATLMELREVATKTGVSEWQVKNGLYLCGWFERIDAGVHVIRGREIDPQDLIDARHRATAHMERRLRVRDERNVTRTIRKQPRPANGRIWVIQHEIVGPIPGHGVVTLPSDTVPLHQSGNYRLPDGHTVTFLDAGGTVTLRGLGGLIRERLSETGSRIEFRFDGESKTLDVVRIG